MVTVSKQITRLEHSAIKLTVTVAKHDVCSEYDKLITDYCKTIAIPGFRKGKVPKAVLEKKLGDSLKDEVLNCLLDKASGSIFDDPQFPPQDRPLSYSSPAIEERPVFDLNADMVFSIVYDVFPQVTMGQWQGLEIEVPDVSIADEDINRELEHIRERNAVVQDKSGGGSADKGDVVTVNYAELTESGEIEAGTERQDFVFTLGSGHNLFKFDEDIIAMKKGETKDIIKAYPEDFEDKDLAGKTKRIRVSLTALKEKRFPALDDDFAQDIDEKYHTLEDLKNSIRERFAKDMEERLRDFKLNALIEKIMETTPVDLPESMIRFQLENQWRNLVRQMNVPADTMTPKEADEVFEQWRPDVRKRLHSRLIVETLVHNLGFAVSDEEKKARIRYIAAASNNPVEEVTAYYDKEETRRYLEEEIQEQKLFERLLAENRVKLGDKKNYLEFIGNNG
ncbi:MAG: trigger factor [Spirochaetaceae bacterium]|jgi:trigger factor|nr:trigger factor [Spirochaetaceae bacterium]